MGYYRKRYWEDFGKTVLCMETGCTLLTTTGFEYKEQQAVVVEWVFLAG